MVERIRETDQDVIIIFTSALTSPNDVKAGYRLGINNYVKKPFVPEELDAHIQALMKMRSGSKTQKETSHYKLGKYTLDAEHATLRNDETGVSQTITPFAAWGCNYSLTEISLSVPYRLPYWHHW